MLKGRRQPGAAQITGIQGLCLVGAVGEFDGGDIETTGTPGDQRSGLDGAAVDQIDGIPPDRDANDSRPVFQQARWGIELLSREPGQLDVIEPTGILVFYRCGLRCMGFRDMDLDRMDGATRFGGLDIEQIDPSAVQLAHHEPIGSECGMGQQIDRSIDTLGTQQRLDGGRHTDFHRGGELDPLFLTYPQRQPDRRLLPLDPLGHVGMGLRQDQKTGQAEPSDDEMPIAVVCFHRIFLLRLTSGLLLGAPIPSAGVALRP